MSVLIKHLFLDVYSEASPDGIDFIKEVNIRTIHYIGSGAYSSTGGVVLGEAGGGKKIAMYLVNALVEDPDPLNPARLLSVDDGGVFHTIHHEFGHIMHQLKHYPQSFKQITPGGYIGEQWINVRENKEALDAGFITPYGMSAYDEDFVEIFSTFVTMSPEQWEERLSEANEEGRAAIEEKLALIKGYIQNSWGMDMDNLRDIIQLRAAEIHGLEYINLK
jgi:substrate import-associated zinc metallohydrolase lipoprotein